ncbi:MAG: hypothetical protein R3B13_13625 [Polyangiaceae bacterium]
MNAQRAGWIAGSALFAALGCGGGGSGSGSTDAGLGGQANSGGTGAGGFGAFGAQGGSAGSGGFAGAATGGGAGFGAGAGIGGAGGVGGSAGAGGSGGGVGGVGGSGVGGSGGTASCSDCVLLHASDSFDGYVFVAAGGHIYWDHDINSSLHWISTTGSGFGSYGAANCAVTHRQGRAHGGYLYYLRRNNDATIRELHRVKLGDATAPCEAVFKPGYVFNGGTYAIDAADNAIYFNHRPDTSNSHTVAKYDMATTVTKDIALSRLEPSASNATQLFGKTNLAGGSGSYRVVRGLKSDGVTIDMSNYGGVPTVLATDANWVYFTTGGSTNGVLSKLPVSATTPIPPTVVPGPVDRIQVDGSDVVWVAYGGSEINRMPLAGGPTTTKSVAPHVIKGLTWDAQNYYFMTDGSKSDLYSVPR